MSERKSLRASGPTHWRVTIRSKRGTTKVSTKWCKTQQEAFARAEAIVSHLPEKQYRFVSHRSVGSIEQ